MNLASILGIIATINPVEITRSFIELYELAASAFGEDDQVVLKEALADARADNDEARARVRAKLEAAQARTGGP